MGYFSKLFVDYKKEYQGKANTWQQANWKWLREELEQPSHPVPNGQVVPDNCYIFGYNRGKIEPTRHQIGLVYCFLSETFQGQYLIYGLRINFCPLDLRLILWDDIFDKWGPKIIEQEQPVLNLGIKARGVYNSIARLKLSKAVTIFNTNLMIDTNWVAPEDWIKLLTVDSSPILGYNESKLWSKVMTNSDNDRREELMRSIVTEAKLGQAVFQQSQLPDKSATLPEIKAWLAENKNIAGSQVDWIGYIKNQIRGRKHIKKVIRNLYR